MFDTMLTAISPDAVEVLFVTAIGFSVAGLCACGYRLFGMHFPSFHLLEAGPMTARFAAVPLLIFSAPFLIARNTLYGRRVEGRRVEFIVAAVLIAGLWSLMSGTAVVMALQALLNV